MNVRAAPPVSRAVRVTTVAAAVVVAAVAAVVSYSHMQEVALRAGEGWRSHLVPLSVDGLVVVASMTLLTRRRAGLAGGWLAWTGVGLGVAASLAANTAAAEPTVSAQLVAAWPAVAFTIAFELLLRRSAVSTAVGEQSPTGGPVVDHLDDAPPLGAPSGDHREEDSGEVEEPESDTGDPVDPLAARVAALVATSQQTGRPVGRRTVAKELGISEHRAMQLLAATNGAPS